MNLQERFLAYSSAFLTGEPDFDRNIKLKQGHTLRVVRYAESILNSLEISETQRKQAVTAALLHDYGRFEQLKQFNTFKDAESLDHGNFGAELVERDQLLDFLSAEEAHEVLLAIRHHNDRELPADLSGNALFLTQIVRDADKLDIIQLVLSYHIQQLDNPTVTLGLSLEKRFSASILASLRAKNTPNYSSLETVYDFAIAKLSWFYDLNFDWSRQEFLKQGYADKIYEFIADIPEANELYKPFKQLKKEL